jgi:DNA-binding NtrC family response regulator
MMNSPSTQKVVLLLLDEDASLREELRKCLELVGTQDGLYEFEFHEAESVAQYRELTKTRHFDVLIIDIRLKPTEDGLDDIVLFHHVHSPDTLIFVYSAFEDMDKVSVCVHAMKAGATDCIDKENKDSIQMVVQSVRRELTEHSFPEAGPGSEWLERNLPDLVDKYPGKAVAVLDRQVVADAPTVSELREMLPRLDLHRTPFLMVVPNWNH